jgi:hypothetical protein
MPASPAVGGMPMAPLKHAYPNPAGELTSKTEFLNILNKFFNLPLELYTKNPATLLANRY